jgi:hypothetical protein
MLSTHDSQSGRYQLARRKLIWERHTDGLYAHSTESTQQWKKPRTKRDRLLQWFVSLQSHLCLCLSFDLYPCKLGLGHNQAQNIIDQITRQYEGGGMGGPPGMGMGMGMGGPVMRNAGPPPFMNGGPPGKLYPLMPLEPVSTKGD